MVVIRLTFHFCGNLSLFTIIWERRTIDLLMVNAHCFRIRFPTLSGPVDLCTCKLIRMFVTSSHIIFKKFTDRFGKDLVSFTFD